MQKRLVTFLFVLAVASTAIAQTAVDGTVRGIAGNAVAGGAVVLQRAEGTIAQQTTTDANGKFRFAAVEAGAYMLKTEASGFYPSSYDFILRARQPVTLDVEMQPKEATKQTVEVKSEYLTVDQAGTTGMF